jgi:hypothetical protein
LISFSEEQFGATREIGIGIPVAFVDRYWAAVAALLFLRGGSQQAFDDEAVRVAATEARERIMRAVAAEEAARKA